MDGVVTRLEATLAELGQMGHQVVVVAPRGGEPFFAGAKVIGVPALGLGFLAGGKPWGVPTPAVRRLVDGLRPDVVHTIHPFVLGMAGVAAARRAQVPLVASFHQDIASVASYYHFGLLEPAIWAHTRRLQRFAGANLVTSQAMATTVAAHGIGPPELWPYGVDLDLFDPARRNQAARLRLTGGAPAELIALYVGRLAPEKQLERLAPLAADPGVHLSVVGDGPLRRTLQSRLSGPGVTFVGTLAGTELAEAYASADVFVFPSTNETLGLVLPEALASGLPVVAFETPTSSEILGAGTGGRLLAPEDIALLPAVVREVGTPGPAWSRLSARARESAKCWSWSAATERLVAVYEAVIRANEHTGATGQGRIGGFPDGGRPGRRRNSGGHPGQQRRS